MGVLSLKPTGIEWDTHHANYQNLTDFLRFCNTGSDTNRGHYMNYPFALVTPSLPPSRPKRSVGLQRVWQSHCDFWQFLLSFFKGKIKIRILIYITIDHLKSLNVSRSCKNNSLRIAVFWDVMTI